jgi:hypothetical protein
MAIGIVVMHWDERVGVDIIGKYPEQIVLDEKTLMQLYSQHEFTGEPGMVSIMAGSTNLASYYTGPESSIYVIMVLNTTEDGDAYEDGLAEISRQILLNIDTETLKDVLPSLFQRLSVYPTLNEEQILAMIYSDEPKRMILKRLQQEAAIPKSELAIWLKDTKRDSFIDIESIIASLVKSTIIKIASVKGLATDVAFLNEDIMILRRPPVKLFLDPVEHHLPKSLKDSYKNQVRTFFKNYKPSEKDNLEIINKVILDPQCYEVLKLLREAMVTKNDIEKLRKKGVEEIDKTLKALWDSKMIAVFQDESGTEYYCLITDFFAELFFPKYNLDTVRKQYISKSQNPKALIKALDMMREEYLSIYKSQKASAKTK